MGNSDPGYKFRTIITYQSKQQRAVYSIGWRITWSYNLQNTIFLENNIQVEACGKGLGEFFDLGHLFF
jgi:hypothetical protein